MVAGAYIASTGKCTIRSLAGIGRDMPWTSAAFVATGLGLVGMPLTVGFVSKWYLVQAAFAQNAWIVAIFVLASSLLTLIYLWRFVESVYFKPAPEGISRCEAPASLLIPLWSLTLLSLFFGVDTGLTSAAASRAANALIAASNLFWQ